MKNTLKHIQNEDANSFQEEKVKLFDICVI